MSGYGIVVQIDSHVLLCLKAYLRSHLFTTSFPTADTGCTFKVNKRYPIPSFIHECHFTEHPFLDAGEMYT